jgi:hypothetical protein
MADGSVVVRKDWARPTQRLGTANTLPNLLFLLFCLLFVLLIVMLYVLFMCICVLPPDVNPIAVDEYINQLLRTVPI